MLNINYLPIKLAKMLCITFAKGHYSTFAMDSSFGRFLAEYRFYFYIFLEIQYTYTNVAKSSLYISTNDRHVNMPV